MKLVKLNFNEELGVRLFWLDGGGVKQRIWIAAQHENPGCNADAIVEDIQKRWINIPETIAIWAGVDESRDAIVGHIVAWVQFSIGFPPEVFVFQLISDPESGALMTLKNDFLKACSEWIDHLNDLYERAHSPFRIAQSFKFNTRHEQAFSRIFAGRATKHYAVLEIDVGQDDQVSREVH